MGICINHPDRETSYICSKHGIYLCEECLECRDPNIYCKFRSACPIWYEHKRKMRRERRKSTLEGVKNCRVTFLPGRAIESSSTGNNLNDTIKLSPITQE